jgi:hypothetical protein
MRSEQSNQLPGPLRRAAERFERWRQVRERGAPIPERLWALAVELAATYGVNKTSSALKVDYYSLKKRLSQGAALAGPAFLELPAAALAAPAECIIDCENSAGARMRIHLKGAALPDLAALGRSLWSAE